MSIRFRSLALGLAVGSAVLLAACGGGSDASSGGSDNTAGNNNSGNNQGGSVSPSGIDRYVGTLKSNCYRHPEVLNSGAAAYAIETRTTTKVDASTLEVAYKTEFFASTDSACAGAVLATHTQSGGTGNRAVVSASVSVAGASGSVSADKVTWTRSAFGGISAGGTVTFNQLVYPGNYFVRALNEKNLLSPSVDGSRILVGDTSARLDTDGFPTTLRSDLYFVKQ